MVAEGVLSATTRMVDIACSRYHAAMRDIILASTSPRRKELLEHAGVTFTTEESGFDENLAAPLPPRQLAEELALGKANAAAMRHPASVIVAADTIVVFGSLAIGKPKTPERAREILHMLSGTNHSMVTGYAVLDAASGMKRTGRVETIIHFRKLSDEEIDAYSETGEPLDKAGGYAIQGGGRAFIERYEGDYESVVGLPLIEIMDALRELRAIE